MYYPRHNSGFNVVGFKALANSIADTTDIKHSTVVQNADLTQLNDQWQAGANIGQPRGL